MPTRKQVQRWERELRRLQHKWATMRATMAEIRRCRDLELQLKARGE